MRKILINDCSDPVINELLGIMEKTAEVVRIPFGKRLTLQNLIWCCLGMDHDRKSAMEKMKHLRYAARFRNIPILLLQSQGVLDAADFPFPSRHEKHLVPVISARRPCADTARISDARKTAEANGNAIF